MRSLLMIVAIVLFCSGTVHSDAMQEVFSGPMGAADLLTGGGHMAVSKAMYRLSGEQTPVERIVCAIGDGKDRVRLLTLNTNTPSVTLQETLLLPNISSDQHVFDMSFMEIETSPTSGPRSCLVIPIYDRSTLKNGTIYVFDLETRTMYENCLNWNVFSRSGSVVHVGQHTDNTGTVYTVSIEGDMYIASLSVTGGEPEFVLNTKHVFGECYYAASSASAPFRTYETYTNVGYPSSFPTSSAIAITTGHVGGILLWDPMNTSLPILGWIRCAQMGWSDANVYLNGRLVNGRYLGDMHRVAVLVDENNHPALVFCPTAGMGFLVYDIYNPSEPKFVWQWDNDTRFHDENSGNTGFSWFGSGSGDVADGYIPGTSAPAEVFGVGLSQNSLTGMIHVYIGNGIDGLRAFDFSSFFSVFEDQWQPGRNFRHFEVFHQSKLYDSSRYPMLAWEVRTYTDASGDTYVFTTWKDRIGHDNDQYGNLALTVHLDSAPATSDQTNRPIRNNSDLPQALSVGFSSSNPARESIAFDLGSPDEDASLSVFDMSGRLVRREDPVFQDGWASFQWNLEDADGVPVPNGVYFARLSDSTGGSVSARCTVLR